MLEILKAWVRVKSRVVGIRSDIVFCLMAEHWAPGMRRATVVASAQQEPTCCRPNQAGVYWNTMIHPI